MATKLFGADFQEHFGTLGASFFTFFQIMTGDGWSGDIVRPVMQKHPWAWVFFVPYIILATFMVLNLFIGIIVDAIQNQNADKLDAAAPAAPAEPSTGSPGGRDPELVLELRAMRAELQALRHQVERR
jgi:voltage-gated sodium channel